METYATVIFTDSTTITRRFQMSFEEAQDKLRPGRYLVRYGKPKMIAKVNFICWDIGKDRVDSALERFA